MKTTFNDTETRRILGEMLAVTYNKISASKSTKGAIRQQNASIKKYARLLNGWVHSKIETNYKAKIVKQ